MNGIVCCICNNKGGVGKTTLTCNLGAALSLKKKRVLIIDNDPQTNTTGILTSKNSIVRNSLYELLDPKEQIPLNEKIDNWIYPSKHQGLYFIPNVEETAGLEMDFVSNYPESLNYLRDKIRDYAKKNFDVTLIDCSPTLSLFVVNALHASDCVIVPISAGSAYSLDGLRKVLELISTVQDTGNPDLKFLKLLINCVDKRTTISRVIIDDIKERFQNQIFDTLIPIDTACQQSEYTKETLFSYKPTSRGSKAYRQLAKEFLSIIKSNDYY